MASSSSTEPSPNHSFTVIVNKKLLTLIGPYKKMNLVTTYTEVLDGLRIYIMEKKLYDPVYPINIKCCGDELSSVLGVDEFTIYDVRSLLQKLVFPVRINTNNSVEAMQAASASVSDTSQKRKAEGVEGGVLKKSCDQAPREPMFLYIPPSPSKEESSSDTAESIQGYETAFVKDTSDDSLSIFDDSDSNLHPGDILAIEETFDVEYEIESDSEQESSCVTESGSDSERAVNTVITFICKSDSDQDFWADKSSDEEYDSDLEIPESDKWKCKRCNSLNNPPMRYCIKCWCMRTGWIAPKRSERRVPPKRKQRTRRNKNVEKTLDALIKESSCSPKPSTSLSSGNATETSTTIESNPLDDSQKLPEASSDLQHSHISDASSSQELSNLSSNSSPEFPSASLLFSYLPPRSPFSPSDLGTSSQELSTLSSYSSSQEFPSTSPCSSSQEFPSTSSCTNSQELSNSSRDVINSLNNFRTLNLSTVPKIDSEAKLCLICCVRPANASIIHGKYAHQISCYRCARKLQHDNKRCPVCRRTIDRVVHQITAI